MGVVFQKLCKVILHQHKTEKSVQKYTLALAFVKKTAYSSTTLPLPFHQPSTLLQTSIPLHNFAAMKTHGYISLHRQLLDWQFHNNPSMLTVWMHLLLLAEYEPTECDGVQLERGELLVSQLWLAEFVGISISQLRSCLKYLEETGCITRNITRHLTRIKILHFNDYQQSTATQPTKNNETFNEKKHDIGISINNRVGGKR